MYNRCASGLIDSLDSHALLDLADECISKFGFRKEDLGDLVAHLCYMDASLSAAMSYTPPATPARARHDSDPFPLHFARSAADSPARRKSTATLLRPPVLHPVPNLFAQLSTPDEKDRKQDRRAGHMTGVEEHWSTWSYPSPASDLAASDDEALLNTPKLHSKMSISSLLLSPTR